MATKLYSPGRLKLKVKAATEAPTSATPGSNGDIIVVTDYAITGYSVSPFDIVTYMDGLVLFNYDSTLVDTINIASADGIYLGLNGCKQYIDGKIKSRDAFIRVNNEWRQFSYARLILFDGENGGDNTAVTGGLGLNGWTSQYNNLVSGIVQADKIVLNATNAKNTLIGTTNPILVTAPTLNAYFNVRSTYGSEPCATVKIYQSKYFEGHLASGDTPAGKTGLLSASIDVSSYMGQYIYVSVGVGGVTAYRADALKIWLE